jgi:hypothetical protein
MKSDPDTNGQNGNGRNHNGQFAKGNPGGPGNPGLKFLAEHRRKFAEAVTPQIVADAVKVLVDVMTDDKAKDADRISAAREILDRSIGRPTSTDVLERIEALEQMMDGRMRRVA